MAHMCPELCTLYCACCCSSGLQEQSGANVSCDSQTCSPSCSMRMKMTLGLQHVSSKHPPADWQLIIQSAKMCIACMHACVQSSAAVAQTFHALCLQLASLRTL